MGYARPTYWPVKSLKGRSIIPIHALTMFRKNDPCQGKCLKIKQKMDGKKFKKLVSLKLLPLRLPNATAQRWQF
jgi:hypothetical protein